MTVHVQDTPREFFNRASQESKENDFALLLSFSRDYEGAVKILNGYIDYVRDGEPDEGADIYAIAEQNLAAEAAKRISFGSKRPIEGQVQHELGVWPAVFAEAAAQQMAERYPASTAAALEALKRF